jgi:hypothetical protein
MLEPTARIGGIPHYSVGEVQELREEIWKEVKLYLSVNQYEVVERAILGKPIKEPCKECARLKEKLALLCRKIESLHDAAYGKISEEP